MRKRIQEPESKARGISLGDGNKAAGSWNNSVYQTVDSAALSHQCKTRLEVDCVPICYASRSLAECERKYSQTEKRLLPSFGSVN